MSKLASAPAQLLALAIPTFIGFLGQTFFEVINIFWLGRLGSDPVAAVSAATYIEWTLFSLMCLTTVGMSSLVAQSMGAKNQTRAHQVIVESFALSLGWCAFLMAVLFITKSAIFKFMGLTPTTYAMACDYFTFYIWGLPILYIHAFESGLLNTYGQTRANTLISLLVLLLNALLDPLLIFGLFGLPALGIFGAAIATLATQLLGVGLKARRLRRGGFIPPLASFLCYRPQLSGTILKIGAPSGATNFIWNLVFPLLITLITTFGMAPLAGLNIANRLEGIPFFLAMAMGVAATTLCGNAYGAREMARLRSLAWWAVVLTLALIFPVMLAFILLPQELLGLLNQDPAIVREGARYLHIVGYSALFLGIELVCEGILNGMGATKIYMLVRVPLTLGRYPAAYLLIHHWGLGLEAIWWVISGSTIIKGIILIQVLIRKLPRGQRCQMSL